MIEPEEVKADPEGFDRSGEELTFVGPDAYPRFTAQRHLAPIFDPEMSTKKRQPISCLCLFLIIKSLFYRI